MDEQIWFYRKNDQQIGPVSRDEIIRLLMLRELSADSYVWTEGIENWQPIGQIPDLAGFIPAGQVRQRPQSVTVLGILNIVFGGMSLLCSPLGIIGLLIPQPDSPFQLSPGMKIFSLVGYLVGIVFAGVLLASGIGLLNLKKWARQAAYIYGWVAICWGILGTIINGLLFSTSLRNVPSEAMPAIIGGMVGGVCGGMCVGLIYPIILVIFLRKPHVIEACSR
jgi:hypothetical protein